MIVAPTADQLEAQPDDYIVVACLDCLGLGKVFWDTLHWETCEECAGAGNVPVDVIGVLV